MITKKIIMKFVVIPVVVLLLVLIVGFIVAGNLIIKKGIEVAGSKTLGVPVTVKSINLSILRGRVAIKGLVIKNPPGYANDTLLDLGEGVVNLNIGSLLSNTIKIELIKLDGTKMTIEQKGLTNNLKEIMNNLPKEEKKEPAPAVEKKPAPTAAKPGKNLTITKLEITGTNVQMKLLPIAGKSDTMSFKLDPIIMENLGTGSKLSIATLIEKVMSALATGVAKQTAGAAVDLGKGAINTTTGESKKIVEGVTGLFGGKKNEPNK
ncbi:MAG: hypothetical protein ABSH16_10575 [Sedimentisphaerales bacterium]